MESFSIGMSVTTVYTAPSDERTIVSLQDDVGGVVLNMGYCKNFCGFKSVLVLSSRARPAAGSKWGPPEYVHNFTFTPGTILALTAKALMVFTVRVVFVCQFVVSAGVSTALTSPVLLVCELSSSLTEDHTHTQSTEKENQSVDLRPHDHYQRVAHLNKLLATTRCTVVL